MRSPVFFEDAEKELASLQRLIIKTKSSKKTGTSVKKFRLLFTSYLTVTDAIRILDCHW